MINKEKEVIKIIYSFLLYIKNNDLSEKKLNDLNNSIKNYMDIENPEIQNILYEVKCEIQNQLLNFKNIDVNIKNESVNFYSQINPNLFSYISNNLISSNYENCDTEWNNFYEKIFNISDKLNNSLNITTETIDNDTKIETKLDNNSNIKYLLSSFYIKYLKAYYLIYEKKDFHGHIKELEDDLELLESQIQNDNSIKDEEKVYNIINKINEFNKNIELWNKDYNNPKIDDFLFNVNSKLINNSTQIIDIFINSDDCNEKKPKNNKYKSFIDNYNTPFEYFEWTNFESNSGIKGKNLENILNNDLTEKKTEKKRVTEENLNLNIKFSFGPNPNNNNNNINNSNIYNYSSKTKKELKNSEVVNKIDDITDDDEGKKLYEILEKYNSLKDNNNDCDKELLKSKDKYIDENFPPFIYNIYSEQNNINNKIEWRRLGKLYRKSELDTDPDNIKKDYLKYGEFSNLTLLYLFKKIDSDILKKYFKIIDIINGKVILEINGREEFLDDYFPIEMINDLNKCSIHDNMLSIPFVNPNLINNKIYIYYVLFEKFIAKNSGSYFNYKNLTSNEIIEIFFTRSKEIKFKEKNLSSININCKNNQFSFIEIRKKLYFINSIDLKKEKLIIEKVNKDKFVIEIIKKEYYFSKLFSLNSKVIIYK